MRAIERLPRSMNRSRWRKRTSRCCKLKLRDFEATAAAAEREGQSPSAETLDNLDIVRTQIEATGREIEARRIEKRNAIEQFELDLDDVERFFPAAPITE